MFFLQIIIQTRGLFHYYCKNIFKIDLMTGTSEIQ